jgi:hypothetical protein
VAELSRVEIFITTLGVIAGNRGFFPDRLRDSGRITGTERADDDFEAERMDRKDPLFR